MTSSFRPIPIRFVERLEIIWPEHDDMPKPKVAEGAPGDAYWMSAGGSGVTDSKTGEPIPLRANAALAFLCPGCGRFGSISVAREKDPNNRHQWSWDGDVSLPTLHPSIHCVGCCGWHGYLKKGIFQKDAT